MEEFLKTIDLKETIKRRKKECLKIIKQVEEGIAEFQNDAMDNDTRDAIMLDLLHFFKWVYQEKVEDYDEVMKATEEKDKKKKDDNTPFYII